MPVLKNQTTVALFVMRFFSGASLLTSALLLTSCELSGTAAQTNSGSLSSSDASLLYVSKQGDTVDGSLKLPVNGVIVGTNQLVLANGNVGIGTTSPVAQLDVAGQVHSQVFNAGASTAINWNNGNVQYTSAACTGTGNQFSFSNLLEGGTYTLVVTGVATGSCNFTCAGTSCGGGVYTTVTPIGVTGWTFMPSNSLPSGAYTVYTMLRAGGIVFVSWISGFGAAT